MDLEARLKALHARTAELTQKKAGAEHELALAEHQRDAALKVLQEEFGVSGIEQARNLLSQVEADLAAECARAEQALREADGEVPA